ncbi:transmembrane emp24 domain-containing protein p24beta2-like [Bidens hawaiensis]|uniref:transmembrane emp24 domain-containing protein p24beta2-like n=1 Tax=Bidens hawaiensis TaxID=980011 RepID=UPI0040498E25
MFAAVVVALLLTVNVGVVFGIRFVMNREECILHKAEYGSTVRFSFVVIKIEGAWHYNEHGVDLVVMGPHREHIQDFRDKISEKSDFLVYIEGVYRFCFTNRSPHDATIDFDVHPSHNYGDLEHAKDGHFKPIMEQLSKLLNALDAIMFEQHWLGAETDRQALIHEGMSRRATHKVLVESAALIGASVLQVYLLLRLFNRKIGLSKV